MKKHIKLLVKTAQIVTLILSCFTVSYAQQSTKTEFDFRSAKWAMTKDEVKLTEFGGLLKEDNDSLVYSDTVGGDMEALVAYIFADGKLVRGKYLFRPEHTNKNDYIADYKKVKETLTLKYGSPKSDEELWHNNLYKNDPKQWGLALSLGHLAYRSEWETKTTEINLVLHGGNNNILFGVIYSSKKLGHLEERIKGK